MIIYPAIDLRQGRCVRLQQGLKDTETVYGDDPAQVARRWAAEGAAWLHVVNLDGAFGDQASAGAELPPNLAALRAIAQATPLPVQFGGGMRSWGAIAQAFELGASRVILGTAALEDPALLARALAEFGSDRVAVGIDAKGGLVVTHGWEQTSAVPAVELGRRMAALGVARVVYTDVARDGMLTGVNVAATAELARATGLRVIASGGVSGVDDVRRLAQTEADIEGVIIGKALYTGAVSLREAIRAGKERTC